MDFCFWCWEVFPLWKEGKSTIKISVRCRELRKYCEISAVYAKYQCNANTVWVPGQLVENWDLKVLS